MGFSSRSVTRQDTEEKLEASGIEFIDATGRRVRFPRAARHPLDNAEIENITVVEAMAMMRNSDPRLTFRAYTDCSNLLLNKSLANLPALGETFIQGCDAKLRESA